MHSNASCKCIYVCFLNVCQAMPGIGSMHSKIRCHILKCCAWTVTICLAPIVSPEIRITLPRVETIMSQLCVLTPFQPKEDRP